MSGRPGLTTYPPRQKTEHSRCFTPLPNKLVTSRSLPARLVRAGRQLALFSFRCDDCKTGGKKMPQSNPEGLQRFLMSCIARCYMLPRHLCNTDLDSEWLPFCKGFFAIKTSSAGMTKNERISVEQRCTRAV